jgi:hypothetical protein
MVLGFELMLARQALYHFSYSTGLSKDIHQPAGKSKTKIRVPGFVRNLAKHKNHHIITLPLRYFYYRYSII